MQGNAGKMFASQKVPSGQGDLSRIEGVPSASKPPLILDLGPKSVPPLRPGQSHCPNSWPSPFSAFFLTQKRNRVRIVGQPWRVEGSVQIDCQAAHYSGREGLDLEAAKRHLKSKSTIESMLTVRPIKYGCINSHSMRLGSARQSEHA